MEIVQVDSLDHRIRGYYVTDSDRRTDQWTWTDRGNGPEVVVPEECYGPFPTEAEAAAWLEAYNQEA